MGLETLWIRIYKYATPTELRFFIRVQPAVLAPVAAGPWPKNPSRPFLALSRVAVEQKQFSGNKCFAT
jgi:hypothetical protein